jgi:hypothetical protein
MQLWRPRASIRSIASLPGERLRFLAMPARSNNSRDNFGAPINYLTSPQFGEATQTLNNFLGGGGQNGGLTPLYQIGGPRSIQLALKLQF